MKIIILLFLLCLLLTQYKVKDGFTSPKDSLTLANNYLTEEIKETIDPERRQKLTNANNYIYFIKTLFNEDK